jgi:hypothetical protein
MPAEALYFKCIPKLKKENGSLGAGESGDRSVRKLSQR